MARKATKAAQDRDVEAQHTPEGNGKPPSKTAAIRAALAEGHESPEAGTNYIRKTFGIEMSRQHFSATKSQLKSKEAEGKVAKGSPGGQPKEAPSQAVEGPLTSASAGGSDLLDAMEAMKPLVASLGKEQVKRIVDLLG